MGDTFQVWVWIYSDVLENYFWNMVWAGEDDILAFQALRNFKQKNPDSCVKLEWR